MPERALTDAQLSGLLARLPDADSVELKLTVPEDAQRSSVAALGMDPLEAQIRQVFFFDTPDLALDAAGVVVRARRVQGKGDDSVVKLRPVEPGEIPHAAAPLARVRRGDRRDARRLRLLRVDEAAIARRRRVKESIHGDRPLRKLFSKEQRAFYAEHAPEGLGFEDLAVLGPIFVLKLKWAPAGLPRKLVAEFWLDPDDSRILELSSKCAPADAFTRPREMRAFLAATASTSPGSRQTKTRRALEFFAGRAAVLQPG